MIKPKALKKGDTIGLIGTSGATPAEKIPLAIKAMEDLGFQVILCESCYEKHGYLSGTDEIRANDMNQCFKDNRIDGIFVIRGGYGSQRILNRIDYDAVKGNPKVFAGYSDVTALHVAFNQICDLMTYHTPMPSSELCNPNLDAYTKEFFLNAVFSDKPLGTVKNPEHKAIEVLVGGKGEGRLTGGNLTMIATSMGTPYEISTEGKILFIEDVGEEPYRIDRMLVQLRAAGKLQSCAGIILGEFTNCEAQNPERSLTLMEVFHELIVPLNIPTIYNVACGHTLPTMTLPLGADCRIDNNRITFLS